MLNGLTSLPLREPANRAFVEFVLPARVSDFDVDHVTHSQGVEASIHLIADTFPGWLGGLLARLPAWEGRLAEYVAAVADRWFARPEYRALLAQLLFEHRDRLWDLLVWRGRHGQAPIQVSQHPEYWLHLDVGASVRAILKGNKALFLHTRPVQESLKDPLFFELDPSFWREVRVLGGGTREGEDGDRVVWGPCW